MTAVQNKHNTRVPIEEKSIRWNGKAQRTFYGEWAKDFPVHIITYLLCTFF